MRSIIILNQKMCENFDKVPETTEAPNKEVKAKVSQGFRLDRSIFKF